jgi:hypothetical protein
MYQETSYEAYKTLEKLNEKQLSVLEAIRKLGTCNDKEIAKLLWWPINRITPRRGELAEMGKIVEAERKKDPETNRTVIYWKVPVTEYQLQLF